jgi:hypothetical protein
MNQNVVKWVVESCDYQNAKSPQDYIGMANAWHYAMENVRLGIDFDGHDYRGFGITVHNLQTMIALIRNVNHVPFRSQRADFANGNSALKPQFIERQLDIILTYQGQMNPQDFYYDLMEIHPWDDGNGRVGTICFNLLNLSLDNPIHPKNDRWNR